ncbi:MAG: hypothetical protein STSR0004_13040 [Peptococcaceae bacterium]
MKLPFLRIFILLIISAVFLAFLYLPSSNAKEQLIEKTPPPLIWPGGQLVRFQPGVKSFAESAKDAKEIAPGTKYYSLVGRNWDDEPLSGYVVEINPSQRLLEIYLSMGGDNLGRLETMSQMAKRHGAVAAVNGGFFNSSNGFPIGTLVKDGQLLNSEDLLRTAVGIKENNQLFLGYYAPAKESIPRLKHLVTAGPLLVLEGQPLWQGVVEGFRGQILKRAARTAVGVNKQGHLLFVVVDGRQKDPKAGLSLEEMAYLMVDLGAQSAAALDGGGSSAMWAKDRLVSHPSDGKERKIANAFLILHQVPVYLNEKRLFFDVPPETEKGRVLVPLRGIFEALQAKVDWDQSAATVTAVLEDKTILLTMGKQEALINEQKVWLDVPPQVRADRTMVPLRFVSEALGAKVIWQNNPPTIFINK